MIKPNLIAPKPPSQPAQTNPAVIFEMAKIALDAGAKVTVADSPAWSDTAGCLKALNIYKQLLDIGVQIRDLNLPQAVVLPNTGIKVKLSRIALEADKIINLPKLKAHQQMTATIAVKNMFGAVPGKSKALWHYRKGENTATFAAMLLDIYLYLKPVVNIIDAVTAMEGQGPINGTAKHIGLMIAGEDAICCEAVCAKVLDINANNLPIIKAAEEIISNGSRLEKFELIGDDYNRYICKDFKHSQIVPLKFTLPRVCKSVAKQVLLMIKGE